MGRGGREPTREVLPGAEILARARLGPDDLAHAGRVARAIRAELWYGSLDGARLQARVGATRLMTAERPWQAPALLYLGLGRERAAVVCVESAPRIIAACATDLAAIRRALRLSPIEGVTRLLELVDVLGPIMWLAPTRALTQIADGTAELTAAAAGAAADANDELAASGTREADRRLRSWPRISVDGDAAAEIVCSYQWPTEASLEWDEQPRLELVMACDVSPTALHPTRAAGALKGRRWSPGL